MPSRPSTRNLQRRLQFGFSRACMQRGERYFYAKAVMAVHIDHESARAEVVGTQIYPVSLHWGQVMQGTIKASCVCPYFKEGHMCKHLWALILHLDDVGEPPSYISKLPLRLVYSPAAEPIVPSAASLAPQYEAKSAVALGQWRQALKNSPQGRDANTVPNQAHHFITLSADERDKTAVKFRFFSVEREANGQWGIPRPLALSRQGEIRNADPQVKDALKTIATLALGESVRPDRYLNHRFPFDQSTRTLNINSLRLVLANLLETGRVYSDINEFSRSHQANENLHLKFTHLERLVIKVSENEQGYVLSANINLRSMGEAPSVLVQNLKLIASPNLFRFNHQIGFLELTETEQAWFDELSGGNLLVPHEDQEAFLEASLGQPLAFELPPSLNWPIDNVLPRATLELRSNKEIGRERYWVDLKFQYGSRHVSYSNPLTQLPSFDDRRIYLRDRLVEGRIYNQLPLHLLNAREGEESTLLARNLSEFVKAALTMGLPVMVESKRVQEANDFQISVTSGVDWFDVDGQAGFSGRWVKIPSILEAISRGESFVPLPDGTMGMITDQMTKRLEKLATFAGRGKDNLRFSSAQGLMLNALLENETNLNLDAKFAELREKLKGFSGIKPCDPVAGFKGKLRKYQREGLGWLEFLNSFGLGGILADDMGLGKTIQCLAFLEARRSARRGPSLLLAPKSVLENWQLEAKRFTPQLKVLIYAGANRTGSDNLFKNHHLIVTTYQTMLRDIETLKEIPWDCVVIDEAQAIKNPGALISKATKLLPAQFRLAMTGTPIENSVQDLFSISDFVNPGFLNGNGRRAHLKLTDETRDALSRAFKPVVLRRTKEQVLKDLPEKTEQVITVELESKQLKIYNELKRFYQGQLMREVSENGIKKSQIQILAALTRLRQVALHPGLVDPAHANSKSSKFEVMLEMLEEIVAEGHRVLIFSQFTSLLALLKKELQQRKIKFCYLDGQTSKRQTVVNEFKESTDPVFLMSLKAGGVGLNLVEANYVFLLDPWWNPAVEAQAIDRVHRIGQKRAVNAYRFIAKNTVEEKILELQQTKRGLSEELFGQKSSPLGSLTTKDIENLFS